MEKLYELRVELVFHSLDVMDRECQHLGVHDCLHCEVTKDFNGVGRDVVDEFVYVDFVLEG